MKTKLLIIVAMVLFTQSVGAAQAPPAHPILIPIKEFVCTFRGVQRWTWLRCRNLDVIGRRK